jgi:hypothetical protein
MPVMLQALAIGALLAQFWAGALERPVDESANGEFAHIGAASPETGPAWACARTPEGRSRSAPAWGLCRRQRPLAELTANATRDN